MVGAEIVKLCILKMPPTPEKYRARLLILGLALAEKEKSYPKGPTEDSIVACVAGLGVRVGMGWSHAVPWLAQGPYDTAAAGINWRKA